MSNHLKDETSPYLLQHADNPVEWYPWGEPALKLAREQDRPILLSIGYSACHWCHVMAHESFEDEDIAALMNRHFVNIKVDREERPDLDRIYQLAHQIMSQRAGGWPLTVVLDPRTHAPFFAGTYFPPEPRHGMPAFPQLLTHIAEWYGQHKDTLADQPARLREVFERIEAGTPTQDALTRAPIDEARRMLGEHFDRTDGGFSPAPKFPHPVSLELLLHGDARARDMALFTLKKMALGGLYDHLGGAFCRYSVDAKWMIPHFEKMLYDNGPLLALCSAAGHIDPDPVFAIRAAHGTADWVMREMQSSEGGYYSSLDADSEGHEGKFYVWTREEVENVLGEEYPLFARRFGFDRPANFEGQWHLHAYEEVEPLAAEFKLEADEVTRRLAASCRKLFALRERRVRPGRDDKILTSWNALMIEGMSVTSRLYARDDCRESAQRALAFIREHLWKDGRLLATYKDGRAHLNAYLDDYAFLLHAILDLLQSEWRSDQLQLARQLADALLEHFEDRENGGFYFTANDHEALLHRTKPVMDESMPSGNGMAARALLRLGHLVGEPRYLDAAERCLRCFWEPMTRQPLASVTLLLALEEFLDPPEIVIVRVAGAAESRWREALQRGFSPSRAVYLIPADAAGLPPALADKTPQGEAIAYVCKGMQCSAPRNLEKFARAE